MSGFVRRDVVSKNGRGTHVSVRLASCRGRGGSTRRGLCDYTAATRKTGVHAGRRRQEGRLQGRWHLAVAAAWQRLDRDRRHRLGSRSPAGGGEPAADEL